MATAKQFQVDTGGTLTTGLVSYWNMEGNSNDYWGTNNGSDSGVSYGSGYGKVNEGVNSPNASGTIAFPSHMVTGNNVSISAWFNVSASGQSFYATALAGQADNSSYGGYWWASIDSSSSYMTGNWVGGFCVNGTRYALASGVAISPGTWTMVTITYDGTTIRLYVNGVQDATQAVSGTLDAFGGGGLGPLQLFYETGSGDGFAGDIDEVGLWNKTLSSTEVTNLYNGGAGQTIIWGDTQSDSMMNAASRFATVAGNILTIIKNVAVTMMNAASRTTTLVGTITKYVKALSVSMMNSVSRFVTIFAQPSIYFRTLSVSMMNSVSRLAVLTTGNMKILVVNMMNAAGRFTTLFSQQMLFIRNLTVNMMYAVNRLTSFIVSIPGQWNFRMKNIASWAFRSKHNTSWTFRNKDSLGPENIPSQPN